MSLVDLVVSLYQSYEYHLARADKRVADWPLMKSCWPTLSLTSLYLLSVIIGSKMMSNRKPYDLKYPLFLYNMSMVGLNAYICFELFFNSYKLSYSFTCQPVNYSDDPNELRIAKALWWYYFSKLLEFSDTIFIILRKNNRQISFLHVYHHSTMFPFYWIGVKWVAGGEAFFAAMINSFVHVIMYSYYGLSALGPGMQKYLWWKQYLTILQLIQFGIGMIYSARSIYFDCAFPTWMMWGCVIYGITLVGLFLNFYFRVYVRSGYQRKK